MAAGPHSPIGNAVIDHALALEEVADPREAAEALVGSLAGMGFVNVAMGEFTDATTARSLFFASLWPDRICEQYFEEGFADVDYLVPQAMTDPDPFTWEDSYRRIQDRPQADDLHDFVLQNFWEDGLVVPVHMRDGRRGLVSMGANRLEMPPEAVPAVEAMAVLTYLKARDLARAAEAVPDLTRRELEVMHWVAAGKTDGEIADILTISQSTAHFHVENAKRKLGCINRTQAAARAVHLGLVKP